MSIQLPENLESLIGSERKLFSVKAKYAHTRKNAMFIIFWSFLWNGILAASTFEAFSKWLSGQGVLTVTEIISYTWSFIFSELIFWLFILIGFLVLIRGIVMFFQTWWYFVGTQTRFITSKKGEIRSIDWEQFNWNIQVKILKDTWNITLLMRTWKMSRNNEGGDQYVPDKIEMVEISNVVEVERICREMIKDNDPTPAS